MIARLTVEYGEGLTEYPIAEEVRGGWQNGVRFYPDENVTEVKPLHVVLAAPILDEDGPIATNPILRGVDLAMDRLVRTDTFTERTIRVLDELRAQVLGVETPEELRAHYPADRSDDPCPEWNCPDLSVEDRREGKTCPAHPCTCPKPEGRES